MKKKDSKSLWKYIKEKIGRRSKSTGIDHLIINNTKIDDKTDIVNNLNNYFTNIGTTLAKQIHKPKPINISRLNSINVNSHTIFLNPVSEQEIKHEINSLANKSGSEDGCTTKLIKIISDSITHPLKHIFNLIISSATWPQHLKAAQIIPIHKNGSKTDLNNYRPISLISNIAKICEKIIHK